jgi:hypothetical protein
MFSDTYDPHPSTPTRDPVDPDNRVTMGSTYWTYSSTGTAQAQAQQRPAESWSAEEKDIQCNHGVKKYVIRC